MSATSITATPSSNAIAGPGPSSRSRKGPVTAQRGSSLPAHTKPHPLPDGAGSSRTTMMQLPQISYSLSRSSHSNRRLASISADSSTALHRLPAVSGASYCSLTRRLQMLNTSSITNLLQTNTYTDRNTQLKNLADITRKNSRRDRHSLEINYLSLRRYSESDPVTSMSISGHEPESKEPVPIKLDAEARRQAYSEITFSLSQLTNVMRQERSFEQLPDDMKEKQRKRSGSPNFKKKKISVETREAVITVPMDQELKNFKKDYFFRLEEAGLKRKSLRNRKRWLKTYRKIQSVLRISKNMAERSATMEKTSLTYVDIGDSLTASVDYSAGRSIDMEMYKRKKEISVSSSVLDTLNTVPEERTLVQLEEVRRELQKVQVFTEYPIDIQEHVIRRAFYLMIGPKRVILRQGHFPQNFFIIICGQAYVKKHVWDDEKEQMVATTEAFLKTGDTFGTYALMRGVDRTSSVISRTNMQLLAIYGEDYLNLIFRGSLPNQLPPHLHYLSQMNFMENFPVHLLRERLSVCAQHHFRRNTVITHDSKKCHNLFIIKYGYCKVFRKIGNKQELELDQESTVSTKRKKSTVLSLSVQGNDERYIERDSPYVSYVEVLSPFGHPVRVPVTKLSKKMDKPFHQPLSLPQEQRQFVPLALLREGAVFGLDQIDMCPSRAKSRSTILVSLGAEVIALNKDYYCHHAGSEAREVVEKVFIYDDIFIHRRLRERVNRDVHLEEVLKFYFLKMSPSARLHLQPVYM